MNELCTKGAGKFAAMIRAHKVRSREVVDAHLDRIEEVNPKKHALDRVFHNQRRRHLPAVG